MATIDGDQLLRDLDELARIGANERGGVDRVAYSPADMAARDWVEARLRDLGLAVERDAAGNTVAVYAGEEGDRPPLALGSHTDTVPNGGRYDGALGVLAGLACVRALRAAGRRLRHPVAVLNFTAEEATMGGGTIGSRAMAGLLGPADLDLAAWDGRPIAEHWRAAGLDPARATETRRPSGAFAAYLELHIEQGGILEQTSTPIGVVEGIVGIRRYAATFAGYANHAGTTPMAGRRDALVMAAPFILAARDIAVGHGIVATCGALKVEPGAPNVIPGRVEVGVEIRGLDEAVLDRAQAALADAAAANGGDLRPTVSKAPTPSDPAVLAALEAACDDLGLARRRLASGAGHDAMCIAAIAPQAMLFVPSRGGVSHSPDEHTAPEDCVNGARVLLATLLRLDTQPPQ
jgi:N-carbamoyl-L-amino-acid hydrolase